MMRPKPARSVVRRVDPRRGPTAAIAGLAVAAALFLAALPAGAQEAQPGQPAQTSQPAASKSGWWVGGGGGYIAGRIDCSNCQEDPPYGNNGAILFQGGVRLNERMQLGGEIFSFGRTIQGLNLRQSYLLAIAQYRPWASQGFFLKGGYGMAFVKEVVPDGDDVIRTWGLGLSYGAGWIFGMKNRVSVAPFGAHYVTTVGDFETSRGLAENVVGNGWFIGTTVSFR